MNSLRRFIVIDDDPLNNSICRITIKKVLGEVDVKTFTDPAQGFDYIGSEFANPNGDSSPAVVFLDINMPIMNGWEFLERYENFDAQLKTRVHIYIVSSSVDERDIAKANANKNIVNYLPKPLTKEVLMDIAGARVN